jgi:hypothetical protein
VRPGGQHPDVYVPASGGTLTGGSPFIGSTAQWPASYCHRESTWLTNVKGLVTYTVPKVDVLVSGTFHSLPYPGNNFPSVANQSIGGVATVTPAQTTLGRPFSNGQAVAFLNIVSREPSTAIGSTLWISGWASFQAWDPHNGVGRRVQPVQFRHAGRVLDVPLWADVHESVEHHDGAVRQNQRAIRFLRSHRTIHERACSRTRHWEVKVQPDKKDVDFS